MEYSFGNFEAFSFDDFKNTFLIEKDLDATNPIRLGELSKEISKTNIGLAKKLNSWASKISNKVERYINRLRKKPNSLEMAIRHIPLGDIKTGAAAIIVIDIEKYGKVEASIFDNNQIAIKMPASIADLVNKGRKRKFLSNKDKVSEYLIGILEKVSK